MARHRVMGWLMLGLLDWRALRQIARTIARKATAWFVTIDLYRDAEDTCAVRLSPRTEMEKLRVAEATCKITINRSQTREGSHVIARQLAFVDDAIQHAAFCIENRVISDAPDDIGGHPPSKPAYPFRLQLSGEQWVSSTRLYRIKEHCIARKRSRTVLCT